MELNQDNENCINQQQSNLETQVHTRIINDDCAFEQQSIQTSGPGNYQLFSPYHCGCDLNNTINNSLNNVGMLYSNSVGLASHCNVDDTPIPAAKKNPKCNVQLNVTSHLHQHGNKMPGYGSILENIINAENDLRNGTNGNNCTNCTNDRTSCFYGSNRVMYPLHSETHSRITTNQSNVLSTSDRFGIDTSPSNYESLCDDNCSI